ncbi:MAG TPA: hypothetical protein VM165_02790, partial [Planctomycetaceae bacterium]|nr:hypothetical protein [Planctomycetaceae bacterium]
MDADEQPTIISMSEPLLAADVECVAAPLALSTDIYAAGLNSALQRWSKSDAQSHELLATPAAIGWKPPRPRVGTFGLTFPEAISFLPPPAEK